jgi:hypothetical protein
MKFLTLRVVRVAMASLSPFIIQPCAMATTITAASVERVDVAAAIATATHGDVVRIPAGTATWTSSIIINQKAITIIGAGVNNTIITNTQTLPNTGEGVVFDVLCTNIGITRISGIQFNGNQTSNILFIRGDLWSSFRIDNCKFINVRYRAIAVSALLSGLIDSCTFVDCFKTVDVAGGNHETLSWQLPLTLGTIQSIVMEDCIFLYENWYPTATAATTSRGQGARSVIRHCTWTNHLNIGFFPIIDAHGNQLPVAGQTTAEPPGGTGGHRGNRQFEMYDNVFTTDTFPGKSFRLTDLRGGLCVIYNNTWVGTGMDPAFRVREEDGPSAFNYKTTYPGSDPLQLYFSNNTSRGVAISTVDFAYPEDPVFIIVGTNLFWSQMPSYTPLEYPHPFRRPSAPTNLHVLP